MDDEVTDTSELDELTPEQDLEARQDFNRRLSAHQQLPDDDDDDDDENSEEAKEEDEEDPLWICGDAASGYFDYEDDEIVQQNRRKLIFRDFLADIKPALYAFVEAQVSNWEEDFQEKADALICSRGKLKTRVAELELTMSQLTSMNKALTSLNETLLKTVIHQDEAVVERERVLQTKELQVAEELAKIKAIRGSLAALLDGSK